MKDIMEKADNIANIMKNFSNKDKLAILCFLGDKEKNVTELLSCSSISQSQISQYLGKMKLEGIVTSEKKGKEVFYKISDNKVLEIIDSLKLIFNK